MSQWSTCSQTHCGKPGVEWWMISLGIDKGEYLHEVEGEDSSAVSFMASVEECISERECKLYDQ